MIRTDYLGKFWGNEGVTMFDRARTLRNELMAPKERYLYDAGIPGGVLLLCLTEQI